MKLSQKKVCKGCKSINEFNGRCELNFKIERLPAIHNYPVDEYKPIEPCYKPKTNDEWFEAREIIFKQVKS